jgi:hypothetical protein
MPSDWARQKAQSMRDRQKSEDQAARVLLENRRILQEQAPGLWEKVFINVQNLISALNAECKSQAIEYVNVSTSEFRAILKIHDAPKTLTARFTPNSSNSALKWEYVGGKPRTGGACSLWVSPRGELFLRDGATVTTPEEIAERMLNGLLEE